jgi:hypothetical protein
VVLLDGDMKKVGKVRKQELKLKLSKCLAFVRVFPIIEHARQVFQYAINLARESWRNESFANFLLHFDNHPLFFTHSGLL